MSVISRISMAGAVAAFPSSSNLLKSLPFAPKLPSSSLKFPKSPSTLLLPSINTPALNNTNSRIVSPNSNLKGGLEEAAEEIEEAFSSDEAEIDDDDDDEESSIDLLFRFLQSMFRKMSKHAKKATRSVLPPLISPQLVSFAVDGVLLLTSLSIAKALLEVVCTFGSTVFAVILLLRLVWATASHFQSGGNRFDSGGAFSSTQPAM